MAFSRIGRALFLSSLTGLCLAQARAAQVAHYKFDEGSGNRAIDSAGGDHNGTIVDAVYQPTSAPGTVGSSLDFNPTRSDGSNAQAHVNLRVDPQTGMSNPDLARNVGGLTLAAWIKADEFRPNNPGQQFDNIIFLSSGAADQNPPRARASLAIGGDTLGTGYLRAGGRSADSDEFFSRQSTVKIAAGPSATTPWTHVAAVFDFPGDSITLYINGQAVGLAPIPDDEPTGWSAGATANTPSASMTIGMRADGNERFDGNIDEVRIFDEALSAAQVAALVPEPTSMGFGGVLAASLLGRRRRRATSGLRA